MSTVSNVITYAQQKAQTDSFGITSVLGLAWANDALIDMTRDLLVRNIDAAQVAESYATISASDVPPGRFAWPTDMFALKTITVNFTDSSQINFLQADKLDVSNIQGDTSFDFLRLNQPTSSPLFTNHGDTGEVFPTPTGTAVVKIFYFLAPTEYTSIGDSLSYPQTLDYRALGDKVISSYYDSQTSPEMAERFEQKYIKRIDDLIRILAPQSQQPTKPQKLRLTGWNL